MKKIIAIVMLIIIAGCTPKQFDLQKELTDAIDKEIALQSFNVTNKKPYYSYYLSSSLGNLYSDNTTNIFTYYDNKIIMNLNAFNVIKDEYYSAAENLDETFNQYLAFKIEGKFVNYSNEEFDYKYELFKVDNSNILKMSCKNVTFYSKGNEYDLIQIARYMMQIAKSIKINKENILSAYSSKETIEFTKESIELFEQVVPIDGNISEILDNKDTLGETTGDDYDSQNNSNDSTNANDDEYSSDDYQDY